MITWNVLAWTAALTVLAQLLDCTMCWQHPLATKSCIRRVLAFRRDHCPRLQCRYTEYYAAVISGAAILGTCAWVFTRGCAGGPCRVRGLGRYLRRRSGGWPLGARG